MQTKHDLYAKRRQLTALKNAVVSLKNGRFSPCAIAAIIAGGAAALVTGPVLEFGLIIAFGISLAIAILTYVFARFPKSWAEVVDKRLTDYEPVDFEAYAKLHERTKEYGGLDLRAVFDWLDMESTAVEGCVPTRPNGTGKRFMSKDVSDSREPRR